MSSRVIGEKQKEEEEVRKKRGTLERMEKSSHVRKERKMRKGRMVNAN